MNNEINKILDFYKINGSRIRRFINSCSINDDECLFGELCFCILTPQSRAKYCREAVDRLKKDKKLFTADSRELRKYLYGVRFPDKKVVYIIEARGKLAELKKILDSDPRVVREWLMSNIKGLGQKESAHFMRNIGFKGLPIIDVHVQNFLRRVGYYDKENKSLTKKQYVELESIFLKLSEDLEIPPEELDIAIWLYQSGEKDFYG